MGCMAGSNLKQSGIGVAIIRKTATQWRVREIWAKVVQVGGSIIRTKLSYKGALTVIGIVDILQYMLSTVPVYA